MTKELRRLSFVMLAMFLALFGATSWIQVVQAGELTDNPRNMRALYDSFEVQRGSILAGDAVLAASASAWPVKTTSESCSRPACRSRSRCRCSSWSAASPD